MKQTKNSRGEHMDNMKHAMMKVLGNMGAAAREGKARRYSKPPVEVHMGEVTLEPTAEAKKEHEMMGAHADQEVDPMKIGDDDMADMMKDLEVQR